jgi:hypothetical protein
MKMPASETSHLGTAIENFKVTIEGLMIAGMAISQATPVSMDSPEFTALCRDKRVAETATDIFTEWFGANPRFVAPLEQAIQTYAAQPGAPPAGQSIEDVADNPTVRETIQPLQENATRLQRNAGIKVNTGAGTAKFDMANWKKFKNR